MDTVRLWFTLEENARRNAASSNPAAIFVEWEAIVLGKDHGHPRATELRNKLDKFLVRYAPKAVRHKLRRQNPAVARQFLPATPAD